MGAPSDLRGMIERKYDLQEQRNQVALDSAVTQADAQKYASDRAYDANLLDNLTKLHIATLPRFAEGTSNVQPTGKAIARPVTPPAPPPPPKPMQGPQTLSQTAAGTSRVPAVKAQAGMTRVPGQGPSNVDSVPAMLAPEEAVLNAPAADMVGRGLIEALNQIGAMKMGMK